MNMVINLVKCWPMPFAPQGGETTTKFRDQVRKYPETPLVLPTPLRPTTISNIILPLIF